MAFSVESTLKALLDDPAAKGVLVKHLGDRTQDSRIPSVMFESLRSISYYSEAGISQETLKSIDEELKAL